MVREVHKPNEIMIASAIVCFILRHTEPMRVCGFIRDIYSKAITETAFRTRQDNYLAVKCNRIVGFVEHGGIPQPPN